LDHELRCSPTWGVLASSYASPDGPANGGHTDTGQAWIFKVVDSVAQGGYDWELGRCGFFRPGTPELVESANEGREARLMVFRIKPGLMPSLA
jgi:hypothetical protein